MFDAGENVAHVAASEVVAITIQELQSVAGGAAEVGLEDGVASRGEDLCVEPGTAASPMMRPAVRYHEELVRPLRHRCRRQGQHAIDVPAIRALPGYNLVFGVQAFADQRVAGRKQGAAGQDRWRAVFKRLRPCLDIDGLHH